jgi:hypothetical protein
MDILYPVIEHYIGATVSNIKREDESIFFKTQLGQGGIIHKNESGNWDLVIEDEKIAEIEDILFSVFCESRKQPPIDKYYKKLVEIKGKELNYRSGILVDQLITSIEVILLMGDIKLKSPITFGPFYAFDLDGEKQIIVLN